MASAVSETNFMPHRHRSMVQAFATRSIRTICVMSVLLLHQHTCSSQESPMIGATKFDYSTSYRTNVCERQHLLYNDTIQLRDALQGLNLSVYITDNSNKPDDIMFQLSQEGTIPENNPGIMAVILDELAKRAGFTWRNRFGSGTGINTAEDGNKTYGDLLIWSTDTYDISAGYWYQTNERKAQGISFIEGYYDTSMILVSKTKKKTDFLSFLKPFHWKVWIVTGVLIFATGILYNFVQRLEENADERRPDALSSVFFSALMFTGHFAFQPNSHAARLLSLSWSFWALITVSAYTANMASVLLTRDAPSFPVSDLEDIVKFDKSVCLFGKSSHDIIFSNKFPEYSTTERGKVIRKRGFEILEGVLKKECDVALVAKTLLDLFEKNEKINDRCKLGWVGQSAMNYYPGGFTTTVDTGTNCTSLISHVLDLHMNEIKEDGFLDNAWNDVYTKLGGQNCDDRRSEPNFPEEPLGIDDMFGIFAFHTLCSVVSVLLAFIFGRRNRRMAKEESIQTANRRPRQSAAATEYAVGGAATSSLRHRAHRTASRPSGDDISPPLEDW